MQEPPQYHVRSSPPSSIQLSSPFSNPTFLYFPISFKMEQPLVQVSDSEVRLDFVLHSKCRANIHLRSLSDAVPIAFKVQTSSPHKFLVNPPTGFIPPLSTATFQIILKPQSSVPPSFPRSPGDRFLIKTAPFVSDSSDSVNSWFASLPHGSSHDFKLKVAFVGHFLLHHAVGSGDVDAVKNMIRRQRSILAELSPRDADSLLRVATELDDPENMVNLLLEAGLRIDSRVKADNVSFYPVESELESRSWTDVHSAMEFDRTDDILAMVERFGRSDLRDHAGRTPLHLAASKGNIRCARVLVELGADKNSCSKDGRTALYRAAANGDRKMVEMLIGMDADPTISDNRGHSAFAVARDKGYEDIVEILEHGEAVLTAARRGDSKRLESLIQRGANVNFQDQYGNSALHMAAIKGRTDVAIMLVELGVDLECRDNEGHEPLHMAVAGGNWETVEALVERGANLNAKTNNGGTPLHMAKAFGYDHIVEFLVRRGASSN